MCCRFEGVISDVEHVEKEDLDLVCWKLVCAVHAELSGIVRTVAEPLVWPQGHLRQIVFSKRTGL